VLPIFISKMKPLSILLIIWLVPTCLGKLTFSKPEKGDLVIPDQCPKKEPTVKYCGQGTKKDLSCFPKGGYITHFTDNESKIKHSCSREVVCPNGLFLDNECNCLFSWNDCYHQSDCQVPRRIVLKSSKCSTENKDLGYCSINVRKPECSQHSRLASLFFVIGSDGEKRWLENPHIEHRQVINSIEDSYLSDESITVPGLPTGDESYCKLIEGREDCYMNSSIPTRPYRIFNSNVFRYVLHLGNCEEEIYCYGREMVSIFDWKKEKTESCKSCIASCDPDKLHIILTMESPAVVEICGPSHCKVYTTNKNVIDHMRDYVSQVSDNFFTIKAWSKSVSNGVNTFETRTECPLMDACSAINCFFCPENWLSVKCYNWTNWITIIATIYLVALSAMATQWILMPFFILMRLCLKVFRWLAKILIHLSSKCMNSRKTTANDHTSRMQHVTPLRPMSRYQILEEQRRSLQRPRPPVLLFTMIALFLLPVCFSEECLRTRVYNFQEEECKIVDGKFICQMENEASFNLERENVPICLHFISPSNAPMGKMVITLRDLYLTCNREDLYFLRDYEQQYERRAICPGVEGCSESLCSTFKSDAVVLSNPPPKPGRSFCQLGDACWTKGCFICTNSCHYVREYDHPTSDVLYTAFQCPTWGNLAEIDVSWVSDQGQEQRRVSIKPGHEINLDRDTSIRLQFSSNFQGSALTNQFLTDGTNFARVSCSPPGQPIKGIVGQTQCPNKQAALTGQGCYRAEGICDCKPSGASDSCDCSTVDLKSIFSSKLSLPLKMGDDFFQARNGSVILDTPTSGSGLLSIRSKKKLVGLAQLQQQCEVSLKALDGCYNCLRGAELSYTCVTDHPMDAILDCGGNHQSIVACDNSGVVRTVSMGLSSTMASLSCKASCSNIVTQISGTLVHVGPSRITGATRLNSVATDDEPSIMSNWSGLLKFSFTKWLNIIFIFVGSVAFAIGLGILKKLVDNTARSLKRD